MGILQKKCRTTGKKALAYRGKGDQNTIGVSEMASAKTASTIDVRIDDEGSILKFRIGFPFGENSAGFYKSVRLLGSMLNFRIGSVSSIGGLIAATLFADTLSDCQTKGFLLQALL